MLYMLYIHIYSYIYIYIYTHTHTIYISQNWTQKAWVMSELLCELRQVIYPFLIFIFLKIW